MIPDVPLRVTSVNPTTTRDFFTPLGGFSYTKIKPELFFGFTVHQAADTTSNSSNQLSYNLAEPAKAVLDYVYLRKLRSLRDARLDLSNITKKQLRVYGRLFPKWVLGVVTQELNRS